jgi:hypothetical protein
MAGHRVRICFDADGLGVGRPARDNGVLELPVIPQPGMELADDEGRVAMVRRAVVLASPDPEGAVAVLVCAPG